MEPMAAVHNGNIPEPADALPEAQRALLIEMGKAGAFYGRKKSKTHPKMKPFIYGQRNGIEIIDGVATLQNLERAIAFLKSAPPGQHTHLLVVGTHPAAKSAVQSFATAHRFPYVTARWIGGTLSNFKVIRARIDFFRKLKADRDTGRLEKYTKKERLEKDRDIGRMDAMFGGLQAFETLPHALFIVDTAVHQIAVREARRVRIPIVALVNTDGNPADAEYPIPINTNSHATIEWVFNYIGKELAAPPPSAPAPPVAPISE